MRVGLVGGSYQDRSLAFDAQRSINLFPALHESGEDGSALFGTPGLEEFCDISTGPIRGEFTASNGRSFAVSGSRFYEITSGGVGTDLGGLDGSSGSVSIDENGLQLAICDGQKVYIFTYASGVFEKATDAELPSAGTITFIDGYFVINKNDSGAFYISALYDGLSWNALDFASAESSPDDLLRVLNALGQLWLLGSKTSQIYTNTGDSGFPFESISGAKIDVGILAPLTAIAMDSAIIWVGRDDKGAGTVYKASGFTPQRISTHAINQAISRATSAEEMTAYSYQQDDHTFYVLTGGGLETTLVFDLTTGVWHERAYLNAEGDFEQHLGSCCTYAFGLHLVGSRVDGKIYRMAMDIYSDDGDDLASERIFTHFSKDGQNFDLNELKIGCEVGVGTQTGQGQNPVISLAVSKNRGQTYTDCGTADLGAAGEYETEVSFRAMGDAKIAATFKVRITDPVKRVLLWADLT